jgi:ribonucleoside-diphosphate reductase alpha subunit
MSQNTNIMRVQKRDGRMQEVHFEKITQRIKALANIHPVLDIEPIHIAQKVINDIHDGIRTEQLDNITAEICSHMLENYDYQILAGRISISNCHKMTSPSFTETIRALYHDNYDRNGNVTHLVTEEMYNFVMDNKEKINATIDENRDFLIDYFGFKTLERAYLLKIHPIKGEPYVIERPQYMFMRVSLGLHCKNNDLNSAIESYHYLSNKYFTHATPTLFHAGTPSSQLFSCFLLGCDDSIEGIYKCLRDTASIEKNSGGIGIDFSDIRSKGSYIRGSNGQSSGIIPALRVFNETALYVNQGGRRNGSIAMYMQPHHGDIMDFLELRLNNGDDTRRARDLFMGMMISDLFMKRARDGKMWSLFNPDETRELRNVYGEEFEALYEQYEEEGRALQQLPARKVMDAINKSRVETGMPYIVFRDSVNRKNNQANLGIIQNSNLCAEIVEYSDTNEYACCCLASVCLSKFVNEEEQTFNFEELINVMRIIVRNLNMAIDVNIYPVEETKRSNMRHRPLGIGVQGLADTYAMMGYPFDSEEASVLNVQIFETMYYGGMKASIELAKQDGPYESFNGSPLSEGKFHFDLWNITPSNRYDWETMRQDLIEYGCRNSMLMALMPTASTAQIMSNNEAFEPFTRNIYLRRVIAGDFIVINKHLVKRLNSIGLWTSEIINQIIEGDGSIQHIMDIPKHIRNLFKTAFEMSNKVIIDQAADRSPFVCQTSSMNLFFEKESLTTKALKNSMFYSWERGLKTGCYYVRTAPKATAQKFSLNVTSEQVLQAGDGQNDATVSVTATATPTKNVTLRESKLSVEEGNGCEACSS